MVRTLVVKDGLPFCVGAQTSIKIELLSGKTRARAAPSAISFAQLAAVPTQEKSTTHTGTLVMKADQPTEAPTSTQAGHILSLESQACAACQLALESGPEFREHCKTAWHV